MRKHGWRCRQFPHASAWGNRGHLSFKTPRSLAGVRYGQLRNHVEKRGLRRLFHLHLLSLPLPTHDTRPPCIFFEPLCWAFCGRRPEEPHLFLSSSSFPFFAFFFVVFFPESLHVGGRRGGEVKGGSMPCAPSSPPPLRFSFSLPSALVAGRVMGGG